MSKVLIIDDENDICFLISEILNDESFICQIANNSSDALDKFNKFNPDLIILDVWLGNSELDGIELLLKFKNLNPNLPIIIISGHGTVDMAVNAIKNGAYDFIEKPFNSEKLTVISKRAIESAHLLNENNKLKSIVNPNIPMIGNSFFVKNFKKNLNKITNSNSRVFISGDRGTGKKLISKIIHQNSKYNNSLYNIINIKNLSNDELKNLFYYEDKINNNILSQFNNNTLIIENINFLNIHYQKKLLFLIENNNLFKKNNIHLDQKIITITSIDIEEEIDKGNFIKALYDRLSSIKILIPSIKSRRDDILPICEYYLNYFKKDNDLNFIFSDSAKSKLELYDWPGNISQIINFAEKTIILNKNKNNELEIDNLPIDMGDYSTSNKKDNNFELSLKDARNNFEREYLLSQIKRFNGSIKKISYFTGMERTALYRKFKSLNIKIDNK